MSEFSINLDGDNERLMGASYLGEDFEEVSLRPRRFDDFVGQEKARANLSVFIEAAKQRGEPLDHVLLYGPPGLGKTTLASIIASEMGVNIRVTSGPLLKRQATLRAYLRI